MDHAQHNKIVSFIWGIADDVLRDVFVRGHYRDVILPMTVIRRLDAVLEPTAEAVLETKQLLDDTGVNEQAGALAAAAGHPFYNTSKFTLKSLLNTGKRQQLTSNFVAYLDGFSPNVQEILDKFKFRNQLSTLEEADAMYSMIEKFVAKDINLSPNPVLDGDDNEKLPGLDNHAMGTVFEHLIRKFNEENNEEAGEHWTPRDVVNLMANLIFLPVSDQIESGTYLVYDGACGTGGMLTVADQVLSDLASEHNKQASIHLFGQEINPETYAIAKADLLLKGEGDEAANIVYGSTLGADGYPTQHFDFMLSNPPYGKSWKTDLDRLCDGKKDDMTDPRFVTTHDSPFAASADELDDYRMITRSNDGQLMFLVNMLSKMKNDTALGSRIAEVHNGSSLFTGDAGQGESNVRRWIIENDWLEAIVALPLNIFYNTGIATYIWVLSNRKPENRQGKVQLIDGTQMFEKLRKNLGSKNCQLSHEHIADISRMFLDAEESETSKMFPNEAFGYWKITVERPLKLKTEFTDDRLATFSQACADHKNRKIQALPPLADAVAAKLNAGPYMDFATVAAVIDELSDEMKIKVNKTELKFIREHFSELDEDATPVVAKTIKPKKGQSIEDAIGMEFPDATIEGESRTERYARYGFYITEQKGKQVALMYEECSDLRDTEQIPLLEEGGIEAFFHREVRPHVPDAWIDPESTKVGYEIPFTRHFYKYEPLRSLEDITKDIRELENETEGLLEQITEVVA